MICHINLAKGFRGGERQTEILIKELSKLGFRQKVYLRRDSTLALKLKDVKNLEIIELKKPFLFNIYRFKECKVIHAHEKRAEQLALIVNLFLKKPYFITRRVAYTPKDNFFNRLIYQRAKKIFTLSRAIDKIMKNLFNGDTRIIPSVSSNLKTTSKLQELQKRYRGKFIITNIGALVEDKAQRYIIESANLLRDNKELLFLLVGEGDKRDEYKRLIEKYNLSNVEMVGFKRNVGDYLEISDIFLFPSLKEGLGSTLIDAMEFQKPIIATEVDGIIDLIRDNYNGLLIEPNSEKEIAKAILKLYNDKKLRELLAQNGKKESNLYQIEEQVSKYIEEYKKYL